MDPRWEVIATRLLVVGMISLLLVACDLGGGGGGGPAEVPLPERPAFSPREQNSNPAVRGAEVYQKVGCGLCHGDAGSGGVANPYSDTGGKITGLILIKEGFTARQLEKKIAEGVPEVGRATPNGPVPPLRMPAYGSWLSKEAIGDLSAYVFSLYPEDREIEDDWDE